MRDVKEMKNLWTVFRLAASADSVHSARLVKSIFAPIWNGYQAVDQKEESGVIPLRGVSY
jgi:hypothetical protein